MKTQIILFLSQFAVVFLLGFQSLTIRDNRIVAASLVSFLIGSSQLFQWKLMPKASPAEMAVWLCAGPLAIICAMKLHPIIFRKLVDETGQETICYC